MQRATIIGAAGFIGAALRQRLEREGVAIAAVGRGDPLPRHLGHVYFCAGLTADFRSRLHDTVDAHVTAINELLRSTEFASLTYLSSTRVYQRAASGRENALLVADPGDPSDLYNLSKMTGEAICLSDHRPSVRVARLSNIFGPGDRSENFLTALLKEAARTGAVTIGNGKEAAKDYLALEQAVEAIARMPLRARSRIINVASGTRTANKEIGDLISETLGVAVCYEQRARGPVFPIIDATRMHDELGVTPRPFAEDFRVFARSFARADA